MAGENLRLNVLLTADGRILSAAVNKARQETKGFGDETERTGRKARVAAQAQRRHAAAVSAATLAIRRQGAALGFAAGAATQYLGAFAGIAALFGSVRKFFSLTDDYLRVSNSVKLATSSTQEYIETQKELFAIADRTRAPVVEAAKLYQRLSISQKDLGATSAELLEVVEGVGQAIVVNSSNAAEARGGLTQLSQALSSGIVRAEEFNSVIDSLKPVLIAVANNLDRTGGSVAELRKLIIAGKVSSQEFYAALREGLPELADQFGRTTSTIGQAFEKLNNALINFVGGFNAASGTSQAFIDKIGGVSAAIRDTDPRDVVNNFAYLDDILKVVAVTFAARLTPRLFGFLGAKRRATAVELGFRRSVLTSNEALIRQQILLKSGRAAAARYVRGVRAATVASRAFATSLAFIGGPTGIAVLAGYALYELVSANNAVDDSLDGLPEDVDAFRIAVEKLTAAQRQNLAFKLADDAYEATKAFEEALAAAEKLEAIANNPPARVRGPASSNDALVANRNRQAIEARSAADSAAEGLRVANERLGIASGDTADKETEAVEKVAEASRAYTRVLQSLRTEKEKVNDVYRNAIAVINAEKAASAEEQEEARRRAGERRDQALAEIDERQQADALARERRFADQKLDAQRAAWEQELLAAMGFQTRIEQQAFAHKQRLLDAEFQHAPAVGNILKQAADFEQAEGTKKVQIGLSLAEEGFANAARFNKKFFELQKAAGIANAIVSTAQGVAKALEYPFPANLAFAALVAAAGAVQIATIRAQPPPQQFALGGIVTGRTEFTTGAGRAVAGEYGSPEGILPLRRGRNGQLGVQAVGGGGGRGVMVTVNNVVNVGRGEDEETGEALAVVLGEIIPRQVDEGIVRAQRVGGLLNSTEMVGERYGD